MQEIKEVKSIKGSLFLNGKGLINGDGDGQKQYNREKGFYANGSDSRYDNIKLAKKKYRTNDDGKDEFKYAVSSATIRHLMFDNEMPFFNQQIQCIPTVYYNALATPSMISRGYMFTDHHSDRRKSIITVTDGVMEGAWLNKITTELRTRSGFKEGKTEVEYQTSEGETKKKVSKDTCLYYIENVGEYTYKSDFFINLCESQFISTDIIFDRRAIDLSEKVTTELYISALKRNFNVDDIDTGFFYLESAVMGEEHAEEGIRLTPEMNNMLVKTVLKNMCGIHAERPANGALLTFDHMDITCNLSDGSEISFTIRKATDVDEYNFIHHTAYLKADNERIEERNRKMVEMSEKSKKDKIEKDKKKNGRKSTSTTEEN